MDRNEAVLRELNLYPQWVRRELPAAEAEGGKVRRADAGSEASCGPAMTTPANSVADTQPAVPPIAQSVPRTDETLDSPPVETMAELDIAPSDISTSHSTRQEDYPSQIDDYPASGSGDFEAAVPAEKDLLSREQRIAELGWPELKTLVRDCTACKLRAGCTQTVFGVGDERASWLFVGEGPGADEDARGEPFVGQAGKLLDNMLLALKLKRGDDVYIANVVKCRPPGNRTPEADEIATCLPYLQRQIQLIQPKVIVALGKTAATALLQTGDVALGSLRGRVHNFTLASAMGTDEAQGGESSFQTSLPHRTTSSHRVGTSIPLIVTYHPAYLLRSPLEKAKAWQDLSLARLTMRNK